MPADPSADGPVFAVFAGGGTTGHVAPALAVAEALAARGHERATLLFVGSRSGVEGRLVPAAGFPTMLLSLGNFPRRVTPRHVRSAAQQVGAAIRCVRTFRRRRPRVVVSLGGFASMPPVVAAKLLRIPVVVLSYDAIPGLAHRAQGRLAAACAVAFATSTMPRRRLTGAPVRPEIVAVGERRGDPAARAEARAALGLPDDRFVVLVFGGSLGSGPINDAISGLLQMQPDDPGLAVRHVIGPRNLAAFVPVPVQRTLLQVIGYEEHMELAYAAADLAVTRAGASTVAELAVAAVPAVLVPWAGAADDHQTANARSLTDVGAAVLIADADLDANRLAAEIGRLRSDPGALATMAASARTVARPHAAEAIADVVEEVAA